MEELLHDNNIHTRMLDLKGTVQKYTNIGDSNTGAVTNTNLVVIKLSLFYYKFCQWWKKNLDFELKINLQ